MHAKKCVYIKLKNVQKLTEELQVLRVHNKQPIRQELNSNRRTNTLENSVEELNYQT